MSDTPESNQRNPLSSSSSTPSGTQALSITVETNNEEDAVVDAAASDVSVSEKAPDEVFPHPVASNENRQSVPESNAAAAEQVDEVVRGGSTEIERAPEQDTVPLETPVAEPASGPAMDNSQGGATRGSPNATNEGQTAPDPNEAIAGFETTKELRDGVRKTMKENEVSHERAFLMFEQISQNFGAAMEDARNDAARISLKLMEFAQANFRNNFEFAREYSAARSVPDVFNVQAAYFKRQMDLMNKQAEDLRRLTSEIASKKAAQIQNQIKNQ